MISVHGYFIIMYAKLKSVISFEFGASALRREQQTGKKNLQRGLAEIEICLGSDRRKLLAYN